jgi:hypothetical protein
MGSDYAEYETTIAASEASREAELGIIRDAA